MEKIRTGPGNRLLNNMRERNSCDVWGVTTLYGWSRTVLVWLSTFTLYIVITPWDLSIDSKCIVCLQILYFVDIWPSLYSAFVGLRGTFELLGIYGLISFWLIGQKSNFTAVGWKCYFTALGLKNKFSTLGQ